MSLSERLRAAALERAERSGQHVDGVVLEPTGVIDLREMAKDATRDVDKTVQLPRLVGEGEPTADRPLAETPLWRRLRPLPGTTPEPVVDLRDEPAVDLTEAPAVDDPRPIADLPPLWEPTIVDPEPVEITGDAVIDLADDVVTAACDHCGGTGQRDLFDRFSRTEYYSCDDCGHMWQQRLED